MGLAFAAVLAFLYAFVNGFGAWMVARRKPYVAGLFLLAAAVLLVSVSSVVFSFAYSRTLLGAGLLLASFASFVNARVVLGRVVWRHHLLRLFVGLAIFAVAFA